MVRRRISHRICLTYNGKIMETFLQLVARDLYQKIGNDLSHTVVVFPNKRASLFFNEYLAQQCNQPLWSPTYVSISELFQQLSTFKIGDSINLVCELYKIFRTETGSQEPLDDFYYWGELLISDFDDIDKNLVDAHQLFSNLQDLRALADDPTFLSPEQDKALQQFFLNFSIEKRTELKKRFISLWDKLGSIYTKFQERLCSLNIAYEGMLYRRVIENLQPNRLPYEHYIFIGFNVLNQVEIKFFNLLQATGKAMFYWDYDVSYTQIPLQQEVSYMHEAGEFILRNLKLFPNELPESCFHQMQHPKQISLISASTENIQARYLPQWIHQTNGTNEEVLEKENAVILCNESLLLPILHSIPADVHNVNITMGFPLAQTPIFNFVNILATLQIEGYRPQTGRYDCQAVLSVLRHPYVRKMSPFADKIEKRLTRDNRFYPLPSELMGDTFLEAVFTPHAGTIALCRYLANTLRLVTALYKGKNNEKDESGKDIFNQLHREALFKSYTIINRLLNLAETGLLSDLRAETLHRLLNRLLATANIPFHGEPAIGMQIMGVLETRNLDFRNLLILSLNEGQLPKNEGEASFIPYNLRRAFGMTTIEHKNAVYAYYFYRLIQRAENITLVYNTSSDGLNRGEMSRFALQILLEGQHPIRRFYLESEQTPRQVTPIRIEKEASILDKLRRNYDIHISPKSMLSPSALNTYLDCSLMFYYRYVIGLYKLDEISTEIDSALFGTIFHRAAELTYQDLTTNGKEVRKDDLETLLKDTPRIQSYVNQAFKEKFFHIAGSEKSEYNGTQLINVQVITSYLRQLIRNDLKYAPFYIEGMEQQVSETMEINTAQGKIRLNIGGTIDRLDRKEGTLRIVDYKTGGIPKTPENIEQLFTPSHGRPNYIFQAFIYSTIMCHKQSLNVAPALLYIHKAASEEYIPIIEMGPARKKEPVDNFTIYEQEFSERLQSLLEEIYDPTIPFVQTKDEKRCTYCDFRNLCHR